MRRLSGLPGTPDLSLRAAPQFAVGVAAALIAVVIWGAQFPIAKGAFASVDPVHVTLIRYALATLALAPIFLWREGLGAMPVGDRWIEGSALCH